MFGLTPARASEREYRIGFGARPQYIYLGFPRTKPSLGGLTAQGFITREHRWELGLAVGASAGLDEQLYQLALEYVFFPGQIWDDEHWLTRLYICFDVFASNLIDTDSAGYGGGGAGGYRWKIDGIPGTVDTYVGAFYLKLGQGLKGLGIEASIQWTFSTRRGE